MDGFIALQILFLENLSASLLNQVSSGCDRSYGAICGARKKAARIKEVLRSELPEGPTESGLEFYSEKIPDFTENTVTNAPLQLPFGVTDAQSGVYRDRRIHLNACPRE